MKKKAKQKITKKYPKVSHEGPVSEKLLFKVRDELKSGMRKRKITTKSKMQNEDLYVRVNSIEDHLSRISTQIDSIKNSMHLLNTTYFNLVEVLKKSIYELEKAKADYKIASLEEPSLKLPKDYKPFSSF